MYTSLHEQGIVSHSLRTNTFEYHTANVLLCPSVSDVAVSYTHLDVYKRQGLDMYTAATVRISLQLKINSHVKIEYHTFVHRR